MFIQKKVKCVHCNAVLECNAQKCVLTCNCGKVKINEQQIIVGSIGADYIDVSPRLLQE